jgi:Peptidase A4 family
MSEGSATSKRIHGARSRAVAGTALLAGLVLGAAAPNALAAGPLNLTSSNWAGYAADSGTYTGVSASWTIPAIDCSGGKTTYSALWVGLDGVDNSALEQTGTEADCISGQEEYGAWWEVLPAAASPYNVTVREGDVMNASVTYIGNSDFTMTLSDATQGWSKTTTHRGSSGFQNSSAEIISEATSVGGSIARITPGTVTFNDCLVDAAPLAASDPEAITSPDSTVTPITNGGETFSATWGSGGIGIPPFSAPRLPRP